MFAVKDLLGGPGNETEQLCILLLPLRTVLGVHDLGLGPLLGLVHEPLDHREDDLPVLLLFLGLAWLNWSILPVVMLDNNNVSASIF